MKPSNQYRAWAAIFIVVFLFLTLRFGVGLYTDYLWFAHLDFASVYFTQFWAQLVVGLAVGIPVAAVFVVSSVIARTLSVRNVLFFTEEAPIAQRIILFGIFGAGAVLAWMIGSAASSNWLLFLRYVYQEPFGKVDPVFGMDISFYIFSLPIYNFVQSWLVLALFLALFGAVAVYALAQQATLSEGRMPVFLPHIQLHLSIIGALIFFTFAWGHWLGLFDLMYSPRGVAFGASFTDINISMPAQWAQVVVAIVAGLVLLANIYLRQPALSLGAIFVWVIAGALGTSAIPSFVQRYFVEPNELAYESTFIANNIELTNIAYGLDKITERNFPSPEPLTAQDVTENETTIKNIRLWDYRPLQQTFQQIQAIRLYYRFGDIDLDRYVIDGELRQVGLAVRELDKGQLQSQAWVTQKLQFTHGYGVVANPVNEVTTEGLPRLWLKDFPPNAIKPELTVNRPEIYYGEGTNDVVYVNTDEQEFNYPSGDQNVYTNYEGTGGVQLNGYFKRLAFLLRLGDVNLMLGRDITSESRVLLNRNITERVRIIAPFLQYDPDPYIVIGENGRLFWILDGYTTSNRFPYSEPIGELNYIRNSVKIVIDAYNGDVIYYVVDEQDPLIAAYQGIFPALFKPMSEMPSWVREHLRYPEGLFRIQARLYQTYHMQDVNVFYNKEDLWQTPKESYEGSIQELQPYYVILSLPGEEQEEFVLIQPFTPNNKDNLIAWLAARSDGDNYGELIVYRFPKQELIFGPLQIEGRIDQDPEISSQITLWDQGGSEVIRGNLLVLPINDSLLYVEPLYLRAENGQIPELKRVIVAAGDKIVMESTLNGAIQKLFDDDGADRTVTLSTPVTDEETSPPVVSADLADKGVTELAELAATHYDRAQLALRQGDWAAYGEELEQMRLALEALLALSEE